MEALAGHVLQQNGELKGEVAVLRRQLGEMMRRRDDFLWL